MAFAVSAISVIALFVVLDQSAVAASNGSSCGATINPVVCENRQTGTPASVWDVSGAGDSSIQGFATSMSVNVGSRIDFKVNTNATAYKIDIYRLGYYAGNGARLIQGNITPSVPLPQSQPACVTDPSVGLVDCGDWAVSASWTVPSTTVSGVFIAKLTRTDTGGASQIPFVVRNDASTSSVVFQTSDESWEAYNRWGNSDFYTGSTTNMWDSPSRARKISYNRPFATRGDSNGRDYLFSNEFPTIRFLERNGYDVTYVSGLDVSQGGSAMLTKHSVFMSVGHDEYWTQAQRTAVIAARDAGVNLMFLSGNEMFWHTRLEPSIDGSNTANRTLVCYKETWDNAATDPSGEATATWRDPRFSAAPGGSTPENGTTGTLYMANSVDLPITVTRAQGKLRIWRNTTLTSMSAASTALAAHTVGYESDEDLDNGFRPSGLIDMSTVTGSSPQESVDFGQNTAAGTTTHHLTLYRAASGALVFGAGTVQWGWGLDQVHDGTQSAADVRMQQAMVNLFADMGNVQPGTLMSGLKAATASTDKTPPTSTITSPATGSSFADGTTVTVTGTAQDTGGVVGGVEVSIDGGSSWHPATGTTSWTYTGVIQGNGTVTIRSRATDDSGNVETPSAGRAVSVGCPCTLFGSAVPKTPDSGDATTVELGVKVVPSVNGFITGVRFYKAAANTGTHVGTLWSAGGTQLATGTFTNETASGWQTLTFAAPVAVSAGTTYVASYLAPNGHYSEDDRFFYYSPWGRGPIQAPNTAPGTGGQVNGLYATSHAFPNQTYQSANYWVDPVFMPNNGPVVSATSPAAGATAVPLSTTPAATFTASVSASSVAMTLRAADGSTVSGTVAYTDANRTATFTPTVALSAGTTYTASVSASDTAGHAMSAPSTWSFSTVASAAGCPCTLLGSATPGTVDSGDKGAVNVGVSVVPQSAGYITGVRFYKAAANTGTHVGTLWSAGGTQLATGTFTNETASGWQTLTFAAPVAVSAGTTYVASYLAPSGHYSEDDHYFDSPVTTGVLSAPAGAGTYAYGSSAAFPSSAYLNANYWVDATFTGTSSAPSQPPAVVSTSPAAGATAVATSVAPSATFSSALTPSSINMTVTPSGGAAVAGSVSYSAGSQTATFTPATALTPGTSYTVVVSASDTTGQPMSAPASWTLTTAAPAACPCSVLSAGPATADSGDGSAVSLGMQFSSNANAYVTGARFWKSAANVGTHTASLWSAGGTLLATATFSGETTSGWQYVSFPTAVAITAGTTYVISYFAPSGHYAEDQNYFASPVTNGMLTAPAGASAYTYGSDSLPTASWRNSNYYVDVVVNTTPS